MFKSLVQNLKSSEHKLKTTEAFANQFLTPLLMHLRPINLHFNNVSGSSTSTGYTLPDELCEQLRLSLLKPTLSGALKVFNRDSSHSSKQSKHLHIIEQEGLTVFALVDSPGNLKVLATCTPCLGISGLQSKEGLVDLGQVLLSSKEDYLLLQQQRSSAPVASA